MNAKKPIPNIEDIEIELINKCKHKNCFYRTIHPMDMCDYLSIAGSPRETPISQCDKYISKKEAKAKGLTRRNGKPIEIYD